MTRRLATLARHYGTANRHVALSFDKYTAKAPTAGSAPLVISHGLFGSKQNWTSLAKAMCQRLNRDIYTVDLRNHGDSPHSTEHTYPAMANDLFAFLAEHRLDNAILLGHSMGGKVVMTAALQAPQKVSRLVVVDMPPVSLQLSRSFAKYVDAMRAIEKEGPRKQSDADKILANYETNVGIRMFLLTNLKRQSDGSLRFRVPYDILGDSLETIGQFDETGTFEKPTLFLNGGNSPYLSPFEKNADQIKRMFPHSQKETVEGAGHWVHSEKPEEVLKRIMAFLE